MTVKTVVACDVMPYSLAYIYHGSDGTSCFHFKVKIRHVGMCGIGGIQTYVAYRRGYVLRYASLGDFVVVRTCTYTNLDTTV